jgi:hypothetical protein
LAAAAERCSQSADSETDHSNNLDAGAETQNNSSLLKTIDVLDDSLRANPQSSIDLDKGENAVTLIDVEDLVKPPSPEQNIIHSSINSLRHAFATYFTDVNPNLPFLNENQFRAQFENHLVTGGREADAWSKDVFVVLVNFIYAETTLLSREHTSPVSGWPEFYFADRVLRRLSWLNRGNLQLIQCLLIKARFLAATQRMRLAYDAMSKASHICFHIGLHDQRTWVNITPFERIMRQRVFWSLFYLDHGISLNAGFPYFIRESDIYVDFPKSIDDRFLFPNRPLPEESTTSWVPYLLGLARWAKLAAKVWDSMFSASAPRPPSEDLITNLDTDILYSISQLPPTLWWDPSVLKGDPIDGTRSFQRRQMCLLHLVRT